MGKVLVPKGPRVEATRRAADLDWLTRQGQPPLPDWLQLRDEQLEAVEKANAEFEAGARVVFVDAPTGSGKTSVAELLRRRLDVTRGLYVCTTKSLQAQVARDFDYARVLKGRANYTPTRLNSRERDGYRQGAGGMNSLGVTCADCDRGPRDAPIEEQSCSYCDVMECPYLHARVEAIRAPMGVLNTAYLLTAVNGGGRENPWRDRELVVADECDLLEDELLGYVELRIGKGWVDELGLTVPKKGSHMTTIRAWLTEEVEPGLVEIRKGLAGKGDLEGRRRHARCDQLVMDVRRVLDREDGWVRDGDEEGRGHALVLKPVSVEDVGERFLWRHAQRWLCMSGTIVSPDTMADSLGLTAAGVPWGVVSMGMKFKAENRRVVYAPIALMTKKAQEAEGSTAVADILRAVQVIAERHGGENILIHTHTYKLAKEVSDHLIREGVPGVLRYDNSRGRDITLELFRKNGGVLVAPSMDRGVDLPGDLCRVQVIVKVPMASLGSRQVSERLRTPGGNDWYLASTVRTLMQMTGRAVRGVDDWAVCYVLDSHFGKVLGDGKRRGMWPQWWLDALELGRVREYL